MKSSQVKGLAPYCYQLKNNLMDYWVGQQTARLISYAQDEILQIGKTISSYNSRKHMDDTGNLLDSLCWGVCYSKELIKFGFYREQRASKPSVLHAYYGNSSYGDSSVAVMEGSTRGKWKDKYERKITDADFSYESGGEPVNGHALAAEFIETYAKKCQYKKWLVFFAILAPYWGYWENGFTQVHGFSRKGGFMGATIQRFAVMTEYYDKISVDLRPAKTSFSSKVETYTSKSLYRSAKKTLKNPQRFDPW